MQQNKVDAIYALREAAEEKTKAEVVAQIKGSPDARDALLDAQLHLEATTLDAIEACHECGHEHAATEAHAPRKNNVIGVAFGGADEGTSA